MAIQGLRDASGFVTDQRPKNWREGIMLLKPNGTTPLFALTSLMKKKVTDDPEYNWWDKIMPTQRLQLATGSNLTTSNTALTLVTGASQLKAGHLLWVEHTNEVMMVAADPASETAITVVRGYSGSTASALTVTGAGSNPYMTIIGNAYEEGSDAPTGINYDPTKRTNYTQIFRNTLEMTRTASKTRLRTGDAVKEAKRECLELHSLEIERAFWFGNSVETTRNGKPIRTTKGILNFIDSSNIVDEAGAAFTVADLEGHLKTAFAYGSSEKMAFCGNEALLTLQQTCRLNSSYQLMQGQKEYGMNVSRLVSPFGELVLKNHPLFNAMASGTTGTASYYGVDSWMFILDMEEIVYRHFQGDDTRWESDLQDNGLDGMKSGYLTECGLEVHHPTAHYLVKGLALAGADT